MGFFLCNPTLAPRTFFKSSRIYTKSKKLRSSSNYRCSNLSNNTKTEKNARALKERRNACGVVIEQPRKYAAIISELIDMNNYGHSYTLLYGCVVQVGPARTIKIAIGIESTPFLFQSSLAYLGIIQEITCFHCHHFCCSTFYIVHLIPAHNKTKQNIHSKHTRSFILSIRIYAILYHTAYISGYCDWLCLFFLHFSVISPQFAICSNMIFFCYVYVCMSVLRGRTRRVSFTSYLNNGP